MRLPRTRGDGPAEVPIDRHCSRQMAPPHTRGWTRCRVMNALGKSVSPGSPAHAGMDPSEFRNSATAGMKQAPPHTRGWTRAVWIQRPRRLPRAPPHTRGWTLTDTSCRNVGAHRWLPRTRGDGPLCPKGHRPPGQREGSPAHAGMDPSSSMRPLAVTCDCGSPAHAGMDLGLADAAQIAPRGGSPAHAGMDPVRSAQIESSA